MTNRHSKSTPAGSVSRRSRRVIQGILVAGLLALCPAPPAASQPVIPVIQEVFIPVEDYHHDLGGAIAAARKGLAAGGYRQLDEFYDFRWEAGESAGEYIARFTKNSSVPDATPVLCSYGKTASSAGKNEFHVAFIILDFGAMQKKISAELASLAIEETAIFRLSFGVTKE